MQDTEYLVGRAVGETQERFDLFDRRRNDREPVAPLIAQEAFVDFLERAGKYDVARSRLPSNFRRLVRVSCVSELSNDLID